VDRDVADGVAGRLVEGFRVGPQGMIEQTLKTGERRIADLTAIMEDQNFRRSAETGGLPVVEDLAYKRGRLGCRFLMDLDLGTVGELTITLQAGDEIVGAFAVELLEEAVDRPGLAQGTV
jgi:hypothetical protein